MTWVAGAGKKKQRKPKEAKDSLDSRQYARIVDLISEGEIEGLKDGLQSIFIDNTPLQNRDGTFNFNNVEIELRDGTQDQDPLPFSVVEDIRPVGVEVVEGVPVTRTVTDPGTNAVRLTITVPQLQRFKDNGDIVGSEVRLQIQLQYGGGGFTTVVDDTIKGRTPDLYQKDYEVDLDGPFPVDVRVVRVTPDSTSSKELNDFSWTSYTEVVKARLRYPNSAMVAFKADAEEFSSIPARTYLVRGIKVKIPSNAEVDPENGRLVYSGIWDGTFGAAQWCSDPAWVLWDLLTSKRYGLGDHLNPTQLDKWAFFEVSKYASELVPNGFGGVEPRFSCNVNIQSKEEAYKLINELCSVMRVMPYWSTGSLTVAQDRPSDPAYLFTRANVTQEGFSYAGGSLKTRPTVAVVSYLDLDLRDLAYEVVEDQDAIARYGVVTAEIAAFACTSRGQAARLGEWLLYSEQYEAEVVSFTASLDAGVAVRPGQVISIADQAKAGARRGGRIMAAGAAEVTVDANEGFAPGGDLSVIMPDGSIEAQPVASWSGNTATLATPFSQVPQVNSVWVYETLSLKASLWKVLAVREQGGVEYAVSAIAHDPSKYAHIERGDPLEPRKVSVLTDPPAAPSNLTAKEVLYGRGGLAFSKLIINWRPVAGVSEYRLRWRYEDGNWNTADLERTDFEVPESFEGLYEVEVYSLNDLRGQSPEPATLVFNAKGKTDPPEDVTGIQLAPVDEATAVLSWNRATDLDVLLGGKVLIRHTPKIDGAAWAESAEIVAAAAGSQTQKQVPLLAGTYFLKFEDDEGNRSRFPASVQVELPQPQPRLSVEQFTEDQQDPPFPGQKDALVYSADLDGLTLVEGATAGEYVFAQPYDMGGVFDVNIQRRFVTRSYLPSDLWDDRLDLIDTWPEIDNDNLDATNAKLYVRTTDDDPNGPDPGWSEWREFANAIVRGRGFEFKVFASTAEPDQNILIDELGVLMELQQRVEHSAVLTSGAGTYAATFTDAFYDVPAVTVAAYNLATGDFFEVSGMTRSGFSIVFKDSSGAAVSRQFTYTAVGYGREIT